MYVVLQDLVIYILKVSSVQQFIVYTDFVNQKYIMYFTSKIQLYFTFQEHV